jgi:hypothetical protein
MTANPDPEPSADVLQLAGMLLMGAIIVAGLVYAFSHTPGTAVGPRPSQAIVKQPPVPPLAETTGTR